MEWERIRNESIRANKPYKTMIDEYWNRLHGMPKELIDTWIEFIDFMKYTQFLAYSKMGPFDSRYKRKEIAAEERGIMKAFDYIEWFMIGLYPDTSTKQDDILWRDLDDVVKILNEDFERRKKEWAKILEDITKTTWQEEETA